MAVFNPVNIKIGPGTLYAAPLGTLEPTSVTAPWPSGWTPLGYTDTGTEFDVTPATAAVTVEEEYWDIKEVLTGMTSTLVFALAETTAQNWALMLNAGIGNGTTNFGQAPNISGTNPDGSVWIEPPDIGTEVRVMLGWDALPKAEAYNSAMDPFGRLIARQCLQTGAMKVMRQKGNAKATYTATFTLEKPFGKMPFRTLFPSNFLS